MKQKKLSVILFTDMVGYSQKVQENEEKALGVLEAHNKIIKGLIKKHHGCTIKTIGDSFFVSFDSVFNAINCAVDIQKKISDHNKIKPVFDQFEIRIGIHVGDVIFKENDKGSKAQKMTL